jgi:hypothetical protein
MESLLVQLEQSVRCFPRYHKYTLGSEIRGQAMNCMRLIQRAMHDKARQKEYVRSLVFAVDDLKLQLRLAKELNAFRDFGQFERAAQGSVKVGKQAGGWLKRTLNQTSLSPSPLEGEGLG